MRGFLAKNKSNSILLISPDLDSVKAFVYALNAEVAFFPKPVNGELTLCKLDYRPVQTELRRLVEAWYKSGPNVSKLLESEPLLERESRSFRAHMIPTQTAQARLLYISVPDNMDPRDPRETAFGLFINFLLNPFNQRLGGPCKHCNKYYVKKTKRQNVYCSRKCSLNHTSLETNRRQRARENAMKLKRVKISLTAWSMLKRISDWKIYVSKDTNISKNFLTRAQKHGLIDIPDK